MAGEEPKKAAAPLTPEDKKKAEELKKQAAEEAAAKVKLTAQRQLSRDRAIFELPRLASFTFGQKLRGAPTETASAAAPEAAAGAPSAAAPEAAAEPSGSLRSSLSRQFFSRVRSVVKPVKDGFKGGEKFFRGYVPALVITSAILLDILDPNSPPWLGIYR